MGQTLARARGLDGRRRWPGVLGSLVTTRDWSVARRFMAIYFALLVVAAIAMGLWVGQQVEDGIVGRTAAVTSLYIESFVSPHLQSLQTQATFELGRRDRAARPHDRDRPGQGHRLVQGLVSRRGHPV